MFRHLAHAGTFVVMMAGLLAYGCGGDDDTGDDDDDATDTPATVDATFTSINTNIIQTSCAIASCHGDGTASGGLDLEGSAAYTNTVGVASSELPSMKRIEAGAPDNSYLWHKLNGTAGTVGGVSSQMPLGKDPLTADQLAAIEEWITDGAQNN